MLNRTVLTLASLSIISCLEASEVQPVDSAYRAGESLYEYYGCSSCHGKGGKDPLPGTPKLAGQDETYLVNQLKDFKSGARNNGMSQTMIGYLKDITDLEIRQLSSYLAKQ